MVSPAAAADRPPSAHPKPCADTDLASAPAGLRRPNRSSASSNVFARSKPAASASCKPRSCTWTSSRSATDHRTTISSGDSQCDCPNDQIAHFIRVRIRCLRCQVKREPADFRIAVVHQGRLLDLHRNSGGDPRTVGRSALPTSSRALCRGTATPHLPSSDEAFSKAATVSSHSRCWWRSSSITTVLGSTRRAPEAAASRQN